MQQAAARLAPVPRLALELRLNEAAANPDLHQLIFLEGDDLQALGAHLESAAAPAPYPAGLRQLAQAWSDPERPAARPAHLYFEWDFDLLDGTPAVFLPIESDRDLVGAPEQRTARLATRLVTLAGLTDADLTAGSAEWLSPVGLRNVSVSHLGAMCSRGPLLRVNYRGVRLGQLGELLAALGWPGKPAAACSLFDRLVEIADKVTVAVNISAGRALPGIGFEVLFDEPPATEPRWKQLFALLRDLKLCTAGEQACLLGVTRQIHPYDTGQPWPASWMVATEIRGGTALPRVERALSHIKVSLSAQETLSAKTYVSAQQRWHDEPAGKLPERRMREDFSSAAEAAVRFLLKRQLQSGWWTEFRTLLGPSDEWATAFVGCALAHCPGPRAPEAARAAAAKLLSRQRAGGGWGYNAASPPDADSTAWALKLLDTTGEGVAENRNGAKSRNGMDFLRRHLTPGGGVTTYDRSAQVRFPGEPPVADAGGWQSDHLCVLANAAPLLGEAALRALAARQARDGSWQPYWWQTPALSTALACEALAALPGARPGVEAAVRWARHYQPPERSAFVESWLLRIQLCGDRDDRRAALARAKNLQAQQHTDGSWPSSADLRIPAADDKEGATAPPILYESRCVFTTAAVLQALLSCDAVERELETP